MSDTQSGSRRLLGRLKQALAEPAEGQRLFGYLVEQARDQMPAVATGRFGAHMRVALVNDGPVTFWLQVPPAA